MSRHKRYVEFTSTGIHVDIDRYLDTPEGKEALDRIDQAGKSLSRKEKRKKVPKPYAVLYQYKPCHFMGRRLRYGSTWREWGRYQRLSDAEHTFDKMTREYSGFMDLKLEYPPEAPTGNP